MAKEWTEKEDKLLGKLVRSLGFAWLDISQRLGRTPDSVRMRWRNTRGETKTSGKMRDPEYIASNMPRVGLFDTETLPLEGFAWRAWDVSFSPDQIISGTSLLSWAGKFLNESDMYSDILTSKEALVKDDERIAKSCWEFLAQCDVVVGHNLIDFDTKVANTAFIKHGLPPIKYIQVDTLKIARKFFKFDMNKMGVLNRQLGLSEKMENEGFPLWRACREGDQDALDKMIAYNKQDVLALEDLFYKLRPYAPHQFNVALFNETEKQLCPVCGSDKLEVIGDYYTPAGKWDSLRCQNCTAVSRGKENKLSKDKKKALLVNS